MQCNLNTVIPTTEIILTRQTFTVWNDFLERHKQLILTKLKALLYVLPTESVILSQELHNKRLRNPSSNPGEGKRLFCCSKRSVPEAQLLRVQLLPETKTMGVQMTSNLHLLTRLRMSGAETPMSHTPWWRKQITRYFKYSNKQLLCVIN